MVRRLIDYIKETRNELRFVAWPTRRQAVALTIIVIAISFLVASYLGFFDLVFSLVLRKFVL